MGTNIAKERNEMEVLGRVVQMDTDGTLYGSQNLVLKQLLLALDPILKTDTSGRLYVNVAAAVISSGTVTTVGTVTTLTNFGASFPATSVNEATTSMDYHTGFRNHLSIT